MSAVDLLPCPFCGNRAEGPYHAQIDGRWQVECARCDLTMTGAVPSDAISAWNRRAPVSSDIGNPISGLLICDGCGCTTTYAELAAQREARPRLISCCPERKMRPATREDWDKMRASEDAAPVSAGKVKALADAFEAGAMSVHQEWVRAHKAGEGPSRGDPEFGEAATDYAAFAAVYAQALKDQGETRAKLVQAETALAALQPGDGWQGIESAPKDGRWIVGWFDFGPNDKRAICIRWDAPARHRKFPWLSDGGRFAETCLYRWAPLPASLPQGEETK